ncbi:MAG: hypothetical protein Q4D61_01360 [Cardiobacteriaceae bacterium]|nr:hypothetical protein [Cardiobacteriaceae bacterium]
MPTATISHENPREQTVHLPHNAAFPEHITQVGKSSSSAIPAFWYRAANAGKAGQAARRY